MKEHEVFWAMLPEGLDQYFDFEKYEKDDKKFRIILIEKNIVPELSEEYRNKKVINTVIKNTLIDFFPIKGRKGELLLKRRWWKFEGVEKWLTRKINLCEPGTKLEKEFASFLKEMDRE